MSITDMRTIRVTEMSVETTDEGKIEIYMGDGTTEITYILDVASAFEISRHLLNAIDEVIDKTMLAVVSPESESLQ